MTSQRADRISRAVDEANKLITKETDRVVELMVEQCEQVTKIGDALAQLLSVDPELLSGPQCNEHAQAIKKRRQELAEAINRLANPPTVTKPWVDTFNANLFGAEGMYESRHRDWCEQKKAERDRHERAAAYQEQCAREQELHERRLRGDVI